MRVLYDISVLGIGHFSSTARAGSHRAEACLIERLSASGDCDLTFCANQSSAAYAGCVDYLQSHPTLRHVPLLGADDEWIGRRVHPVVTGISRGVKTMLRGRALPPLLRPAGAFVDARIHRPRIDADPPVDIHHSSSVPLPPARPRQRRPKRFVTIYDLRGSRVDASAADVAYQTALLDCLRQDDWVLTGSQATRLELADLGRIVADQIVVAPLAADPVVFRPCHDPGCLASVRTTYGIPPGPYLLMLNSLQPRKNLPTAVRAFCRLIEQERLADLSLVLCGHPATRSPAVRDAIARVPGLGGRVISTGYVSDADLAALYSGAIAFVYPSLYEGFGLPPLEAMQCGTPVIASKTSSLPEVVGGAGVMVDPADGDALSAAMLKLYRDAAWRESVRQQGLARAASFTWDRTAALTLDGFRRAISS